MSQLGERANNFSNLVGKSWDLPARGGVWHLFVAGKSQSPPERNGDHRLAGAALQLPAAGRKDVFYQSESLLSEFLVRSLISSQNQHGEVNNDSGFIFVLCLFLPLFNLLITSRAAETLSPNRCSGLSVGEPLLPGLSCNPLKVKKRRKYFSKAAEPSPPLAVLCNNTRCENPADIHEQM